MEREGIQVNDKKTKQKKNLQTLHLSELIITRRTKLAPNPAGTDNNSLQHYKDNQ